MSGREVTERGELLEERVAALERLQVAEGARAHSFCIDFSDSV